MNAKKQTQCYDKKISVKTQLQSLDVNSKGEAQMRHKRA